MPREELKCTCTCHDIPRLEEEATNNHAPAEAQAILDERITSLEAELLALKTMRNRYSPISWLPTETLTQILLALVKPVWRYKSQSWKTHVELTRVCTHWRSIAMQCPQFWSCVPLLTSKGPAKHVQNMLARSMDYPLSIRQRTEEEKEEEDEDDYERYGTSNVHRAPTQAALQRTQYLQAQAHRLRQLYLMVDPNSEQLQQYESLIAQDTPSLETLDVRLTRLPYYPNSARSLFSPESVLSSHRMPSLRTLRLSGFVMGTADLGILSRSAFNARKLTTLELSLVVIPEMSEQSFRAPPYDLLLEMLRASPNLRILNLSNCIGESIADVSEGSSSTIPDKVHLPRLGSLSLDQTLSTTAVIRFLSDLVFPSRSKIKLHSLRMNHPPGSSSESSPQVQSELIGRLFLSCGLGGSGNSARTRMRRYKTVRLHINDREGSFTELRLSNPSLRSSDGHTTSAPGNHTFRGHGSISVTLVGQKLPKLILEHLPQGLSELEVLHTTPRRPGQNYDPDLPATEDWRNFFVNQSSIQELKLSGRDMREVLNALGPRPSLSMTLSDSDVGPDADVSATQPASSAVDETPLPLLRSMSFAAGILLDRGHSPSPTVVPEPSNYDSLKTMLIMRREQGLPIYSIGLTPSSELTPAQHEMKEEICAINGQGTVVWGPGP